MELIGWIGSLLLGLCALPQAIKVVKTKKANDLSWIFLLMWLIGEVLVLTYVLMTTKDPILLSNYILNLVLLSIIIKVKSKEIRLT